MIDEAFLPFHGIIEQMLAFRGDIVDEASGTHLYISECVIELPVEFDVVRDDNGALQIGSTPPLYNVNTSFRPSYHYLRLIAQRTEGDDGD